MSKEERSLYDAFSKIEDTRDKRGFKHKLVDIFMIAAYGLLLGFTDFDTMCYALKYRKEYLTNLLGLKHGIPSHDTFSRIFRTVGASQFFEAYIYWLKDALDATGKHIIIDGKALRAACEKVRKGNIPYVINAFMAESGVCVGQLRVDSKSNEITHIPKLLAMMDIKGATITIDAAGTYPKIANLIAAGCGYSVLAVKGNQKTLLDDVKAAIDEANANTKHASGIYDVITENSRGHGRIESRTAVVFNGTGKIDLKTWPHSKAVAMVTRTRTVRQRDKYGREIEGKTTEDIQYYVMSKRMTAAELLKYSRGHWGVESLHWSLDVQHNEDRSTTRKDSALENLALMRKIIFNILAFAPRLKGLSKNKKIVLLQNEPEALELLLTTAIENYGSY
jgi:predicted transposase YbfD/YdcC